MFITLLKFTDKRAAAGSFMAAHDAWIAQGFTDGVFLCVGSLEHGAGGAIVAVGESRLAHEARLEADPFVEHGIITSETYEINAKRTIPALDFVIAAR